MSLQQLRIELISVGIRMYGLPVECFTKPIAYRMANMIEEPLEVRASEIDARKATFLRAKSSGREQWITARASQRGDRDIMISKEVCNQTSETGGTSWGPRESSLSNVVGNGSDEPACSYTGPNRPKLEEWYSATSYSGIYKSRLGQRKLTRNGFVSNNMGHRAEVETKRPSNTMVPSCPFSPLPSIDSLNLYNCSELRRLGLGTEEKLERRAEIRKGKRPVQCDGGADQKIQKKYRHEEQL
ncbi:OLC1v1003751C1 [Oldenlandia corymbosa var. corymbosa]|uniref:OLC1v1003751C1 n=1 Tax=Oldenlandia corymbosa var. corymbosa TaxID=529605 RepID=A0AAV1DAR0_OLDCO|nr:OLC1v1003751C1 [Oldenlandia corymbosa var. corymbosa]